MASGTHKVMVWVKESPLKEFLVTARKPDARLSDVKKWAENEGRYQEGELVAEDLTKEEAEAVRAKVKAKYVKKGYIYRSFPQL